MENKVLKGTENYREAQKLANNLVRIASYERWNNNTLFELFYDRLGNFLDKIKELDCFAAQVASTIESKMNPYGFKIAYISPKQAWILACASIENNVTEKSITD